MKRIDTRYQQLLLNLNLYHGRVDGIYGPKTKEAVRSFQRMNNLSPDGIIGPKTKLVFEDHLNVIPDRTEDIDDYSGPVSRKKYLYKRWPKESTSSLINFYGNVGKNQTSLELPYQMVLAWDKSRVINRISCNQKVADSLYNVLENVKHVYSDSEIKQHGFDLFGGCLNVRKIRGGNRWSTHAWGIAIDIDPARNGLKTPWNRAYLGRPECRDFVECFKNEGWYSLGLERNYDAMHFQACWR